MNTVFAISCFPPIWTIERHGRRPMMFWTALGCALCLIVFIAVQLVENQTQALGWVAAAAAIVYNVIFGYGWLGPPWVYGPEVSKVSLVYIQRTCLGLTSKKKDCTSSATTHRRCSRSSWRVVIHVHHGFWRWNWN